MNNSMMQIVNGLNDLYLKPRTVISKKSINEEGAIKLTPELRKAIVDGLWQFMDDLYKDTGKTRHFLSDEFYDICDNRYTVGICKAGFNLNIDEYGEIADITVELTHPFEMSIETFDNRRSTPLAKDILKVI